MRVARETPSLATKSEEQAAREWLQTYKRPLKYQTGWTAFSDAVNCICTSELAEILVAYAASRPEVTALVRAAREVVGSCRTADGIEVPPTIASIEHLVDALEPFKEVR
jgi:hypothetical protein